MFRISSSSEISNSSKIFLSGRPLALQFPLRLLDFLEYFPDFLAENFGRVVWVDLQKLLPMLVEDTNGCSLLVSWFTRAGRCGSPIVCRDIRASFWYTVLYDDCYLWLLVGNLIGVDVLLSEGLCIFFLDPFCS